MKFQLLAALSIVTACLAEDKAQVTELQETLAQYKAEHAEYTDRIDKLVVELKKMDADIEGSITKTLEFAQQYTDSVDSRERLLKSKKSIIKDLIGSVGDYPENRIKRTR